MKRLSEVTSATLCVATLGLLSACAAVGTSPQTLPAGQTPRGIVFIVGDGMGSAHFTLARLLRGKQFQIGKLSETGLVATSSADSRVTDSAAAATTYATGTKTNNNYLSLDPSGKPHATVVELAESRGLATGLVTTAPFGDATPAAFAAHVDDRHKTEEIARQMVARGVDVIASGGIGWFGTDAAPTLEALAADGGYQPVRTAMALKNAGDGPVLAVFPSGELDSDSPEISLPDLAAWTIERLAGDPDGFFLLLEHEGTDSASHDNNIAVLQPNLVSLDKTVGVALDVARRRGDILVIVVGDHETGGLRIDGTWSAPNDSWSSKDHTGAAVPIFADGPGAEAFGRFMENTEVGDALLSLVHRMGR